MLVPMTRSEIIILTIMLDDDYVEGGEDGEVGDDYVEDGEDG